MLRIRQHAPASLDLVAGQARRRDGMPAGEQVGVVGKPGTLGATMVLAMSERLTAAGGAKYVPVVGDLPAWTPPPIPADRFEIRAGIALRAHTSSGPFRGQDMRDEPGCAGIFTVSIRPLPSSV
jgi:hypothetical protein